jgi:ribulose-5-phosphate 4-epimerase/fuculose-1-phosphate aldolase/8-oxo-dGTP pyrophosphatase MutT (NUDIX family)
MRRASSVRVFGEAPAGIVCRPRRAAYAVIRDARGRVARTYEAGRYYLPGGGCLEGESGEQAVVREVAEEIGRHARVVRPLGEALQYYHSEADGCWYAMRASFFRAELFGEPFEPREGEPDWVEGGREPASFFHASHVWAIMQDVEEADMSSAESLQSVVSEAEWRQRVDLAACYRLVARFHWDDLIFTHISARVAGPEHHFLINPYGMLFGEITASSLVKVGLDGRKVMDSPYEINPAGFVIHSAVHAAREDAQCVLHLHTLNGVAVSAQQAGVLPISQQSMFVLASLGYHAYEGVALNDDEKPRLVRDLGDRNFLMLRNHGLLTVAESVPEAFLLMYLFESACTIQVRAQAGGGELVRIDPRIIAGAQAQAKQVTRNAGGALAWPALLRQLDREDPSYRS